jgi:insulysin
MIALEQVTVDELQIFIKRMIRSVQVEALIHGNMTKEDATQLTTELLSVYSPRELQEVELPEERVLQLERGAHYVHREQVFNKNEENSAIYNFYQIGLENTTDDVLLDLFCQINKTAFYDQLRTKEQLGYIVWSDAVSVAGVQGFRVEIQSAVQDPNFLDQRIESCIQMCKANLILPPDEFKKQVDVLIARIQEKDKKLEERTGRFYKEIRTHRYKFNRGNFLTNFL